MRHNLTAVFDDPGKARQALASLLDAGFSRADTHLASVAGARSASKGDIPRPSWRAHPGASRTRVFASLLDRAQRRPATARADGAVSQVLNLSTDSDEEAERAVFLVAGFIDEAEPGAGQGIRRFTATPGALQSQGRDSEHFQGTQDMQEMPMIGTTAREPMLPAGLWPLASSEEATMPPGRPRPRGDAAMAAFRFGRDMHENERYRNRAWQEAGADLKVLWEARSPGPAGWRVYEQAVHLGWDSTSPEIDDDDYRRSHWRTRHAGSAHHAGAAARPGSTMGSAATANAQARGQAHAPTAWENFMDALKHGWNRIGTGTDVDETDYRRHHASTYPGTNYHDFAPVYRYGHHVRSRAMFRGRTWDAVEGELRAEWERGHREGKPATWDQMKAALRAGWDQERT
ncbi:hypothetical protein [Massilia sp. 9I]|uniref:hypothetical protein n=1 Tax=Massilia sp. 9I TaxID=2653152 RepID=UPI0012F26502|nr:hypothetical protein [Massilia sp. 9I]VXB97802.1 conserved hypothetical protein [Massilia sp. 9I]